MGRTIEEALGAGARPAERHGYRHSFDMLGEAARTAADAERYHAAYRAAIAAIGTAAAGATDRSGARASRSSCRRCIRATRWRSASGSCASCCRSLLDSRAARPAPPASASRSMPRKPTGSNLSLDLVEALALAPDLAGWDGLGLAVQAYQKRALPVIDWLADLARRARRRLMVRLVKGAYWDSEIKRGAGARPRRLSGLHPQGRDRCLLSRLRQADASPPATPSIRNSRPTTRTPSPRSSNWPAARTRLRVPAPARHGRGALRRDRRRRQAEPPVPRLCAGRQPRGSARLSGAPAARRTAPTPPSSTASSTSGADRRRSSPTRSRGWRALPVQAASAHPAAARSLRSRSGAIRAASISPIRRALAELRDGLAEALRAAVARRADRRREPSAPAAGEPVFDPSDRRRQIGTVANAPAGRRSKRRSPRAARAAPAWDRTPAEARAAALERAADLYERDRADADGADHPRGRPHDPGGARPRCARRPITAAITRAARPRRFRRAERLPGPTGERNELALHGRGVFACISPWNFPLAIFTGQIAGGARRRQCGHRQAGRADAAGRRRGGAPAARGRASPATCCICCRAPARASAARSSPIRASPASPSPARPRRRGRSTSRSPARPGRSCR